MKWQKIIKQETIEEYLRSRGYEKVSEKYNGRQVTFEKDLGEREEISVRTGQPEMSNRPGSVTITSFYPQRGGNHILYNVYKGEIRIIENPYDMHDAYDHSNSVLEVDDDELYEEILNDFVTTDMAEIRDSFNFLRGGRLKMIRLPPRE